MNNEATQLVTVANARTYSVPVMCHVAMQVWTCARQFIVWTRMAGRWWSTSSVLVPTTAPSNMSDANQYSTSQTRSFVYTANLYSPTSGVSREVRGCRPHRAAN